MATRSAGLSLSLTLIAWCLAGRAAAQFPPDEVSAPPRPIPSACPVSCTSGCADVPPDFEGLGAARDDAAIINACLLDNACRCVQLRAAKYLVRQPLFVRVTALRPGGRKLLGPPAGDPGTAVLKVKHTCGTAAYLESGAFRPTIEFRGGLNNPATGTEIGASSDGTRKGFEVRVAELQQSCDNYAYLGAPSVLVVHAPLARVQGVRVLGGPAPLPGQSTNGGGANLGGIHAAFSPGVTLADNRVENVGYSVENGLDSSNCAKTSSGTMGFKVADSGCVGQPFGPPRCAVVERNTTVNVAFPMIVTNEGVADPANPNDARFDSSGTRASFNQLGGAAALRCPNPGTYLSQTCGLASDRFTLRCAGGRALRLIGTPVRPLREVLVNHNTATQFGGREGLAAGSGLDLTEAVQRARVLDNNFDGSLSQVQYALQLRRASTLNNRFERNTFLSGASGCGTYADVNFEVLSGESSPNQCGLARGSRGTNNVRGICGGGSGQSVPPTDCPPDAFLTLALEE